MWKTIKFWSSYAYESLKDGDERKLMIELFEQFPVNFEIYFSEFHGKLFLELLQASCYIFSF